MSDDLEAENGSESWPELSLPSLEADFLQQEYEKASVILEYGSGGSTILASRMPGKRIFSIESDRSWAMRLQREIDKLPLMSPASVHYVDIGPTGDWGRPLDEKKWASFFHYPLGIWSQSFFRHPDVILIDGRFRSACLAAAGMLCERPLRVLFDDYVDRPRYHVVEKFFARTYTVGRMAVFDVRPGVLSRTDFTFAMQLFAQATYHGRSSQYG